LCIAACRVTVTDLDIGRVRYTCRVNVGFLATNLILVIGVRLPAGAWIRISLLCMLFNFILVYFEIGFPCHMRTAHSESTCTHNTRVTQALVSHLTADHRVLFLSFADSKSRKKCACTQARTHLLKKSTGRVRYTSRLVLPMAALTFHRRTGVRLPAWA
jgi:hypothetical protein